MNIVKKKQKHKSHYSHIDFFLFLRVYFELGSKNYRDRRHILCEHTQLFLKFFET
jgi:hypothetical protein